MEYRLLNDILPGMKDEIVIYENGDIFNRATGNYLRGKTVYLSNYKMVGRARLLYKAFIGDIPKDGQVHLKKGKPLHYSNLIVKPPEGWEQVVIDGYNQGLTQREIGELLGVCGVSVHRYGKRLGLSWSNRYTYVVQYRKKSSQGEYITKYFNTYAEAGKFLGYTSKSTVHNLLLGGVHTLTALALKNLGAVEGEIYTEMINYELVG